MCSCVNFVSKEHSAAITDLRWTPQLSPHLKENIPVPQSWKLLKIGPVNKWERCWWMEVTETSFPFSIFKKLGQKKHFLFLRTPPLSPEVLWWTRFLNKRIPRNKNIWLKNLMTILSEIITVRDLPPPLPHTLWAQNGTRQAPLSLSFSLSLPPTLSILHYPSLYLLYLPPCLLLGFLLSKFQLSI